MALQVCTRDEYGQTSNVSDGRFEEVVEAIKFIKDKVTVDNINNALTLAEKKRNWTSYYIELQDEDGIVDDNVVYAGKGPAAVDMVCIVKEAGIEQVALNATDANLRMFIGKVSEAGEDEIWYAEDHRQNVITQCDHPDLADKTVYYIRKIGS